MKVKLKGKLRNFLYQNVEWLFLIIYGSTCRRNMFMWLLLVAIVQILELFSNNPEYLVVKLYIIPQLIIIFVLVHTRNRVTMQYWLEHNAKYID